MINPPRTNMRLNMFKISIRSLRKTQAKMQAKKVADEPIILRSPIGICLKAQLPIVIAAEPNRERPMS